MGCAGVGCQMRAIRTTSSMGWPGRSGWRATPTSAVESPETEASTPSTRACARSGAGRGAGASAQASHHSGGTNCSEERVQRFSCSRWNWLGAEGAAACFCVVAGAAGAPLPGHAPARRADVPIDEDAAAYVHPERDRVVRLGGLGKDPERHPAALRELAGGELDALLDPGLGECLEQLRLALVAGVGFDPALRGGGVDGGGPGDAGGRTRSP